MTDFSARSCSSIPRGTPPLTRAAADEMLLKLDGGWTLGTDAARLRREFRFPDFFHTMSFVNALAHLANVEDHHPDLEVGYNYCRVYFSTHSVGGLSENDFICAAKVDLIPGSEPARAD